MTARWEQIAAMDVEISEREFARDREYFEKCLATAPAIVASEWSELKRAAERSRRDAATASAALPETRVTFHSGGIRCNPSLRNEPAKGGRGERIGTSDPSVPNRGRICSVTQ
jgi:hypothetical protein